MGYKVEPKYIPPNGVKLNLGCGRDVREGFVNLDRMTWPGVVTWDFEVDRWNGTGTATLPFDSDTFDYVLARDVLEHVPHRVKDLRGEFFIHLVNDLIKTSKNGATWEIISPHRPDCLGAAGHTRVIDSSTFGPWLVRNGRGSLETTLLPVGRLRPLHVENHRQWDPRDITRLGRSIMKRIHFMVEK